MKGVRASPPTPTHSRGGRAQGHAPLSLRGRRASRSFSVAWAHLLGSPPPRGEGGRSLSWRQQDLWGQEGPHPQRPPHTSVSSTPSPSAGEPVGHWGRTRVAPTPCPPPPPESWTDLCSDVCGHVSWRGDLADVLAHGPGSWEHRATGHVDRVRGSGEHKDVYTQQGPGRKGGQGWGRPITSVPTIRSSSGSSFQTPLFAILGPPSPTASPPHHTSCLCFSQQVKGGPPGDDPLPSRPAPPSRAPMGKQLNPGINKS